jgi:two-component system KDP operon response regulator KdpE
LIARLQAVLRRIRLETPEGTPVLRAGKLELDIERRTLHRAGEDVRLSPTEFELLRYFMQHPDVAIEHARLLKAVWGPKYGQELEYLRAYVRLLRKKIEDDPAQPQYLLTEPWLGYRFRAPSNS